MKEMIKSKKGVSIMIGYVLLIVAAITISVFVYAWMSSYVPREIPSCDDGTSLNVVELTCYDIAAGRKNLGIKIQNNGLFNVNGFYIKGKDDPLKELATVNLEDLHFNYNNVNGLDEGGACTSTGDTAESCYILLNPSAGGFLEPGQRTEEIFFDNINFKDIYSIEIIPVRTQEDEKGRLNTLACGDSKITKELPDNCRSP